MGRPTIAAIGCLALGLSGCGADSPAPAPERTRVRPLMRLSRPEVEPLTPPEGLPELPLPAAPAIRLIGLAAGRETPPVRMAILNVNDDLVLAHVGDTILGRYTLVGIGDEAVELRDSASNETFTVALP